MTGYEPLVGPAAAPAVQAKPQAGAPAPSASPASVQKRLGAGEAMAPEVIARFSQAYGQDLSDVRLHRDSHAATELGARAVTVGRDVAFAPGEYQPGTPEGDRLIGHELAHVVQQAGGAGAVQGAGLANDGYEREADRAAEAALGGRPVSALSAVAPVIQKRESPAGASEQTTPALFQPDAVNRIPPPAGSETIVFDDVTLSMDPVFVRYQLEELWGRKGRFFVSSFVEHLAGSPSSDPAALDDARRELDDLDRQKAPAPGAAGPVPFTPAPAARVWRPAPWSPGQVAAAEHRVAHPGRVRAIADVARAELKKLSDEAQAFSEMFGARADVRLREILSVSRAQVEGEMKRYGVTESVLKHTVKLDEGGKTFTAVHTSYGFAPEPSRDAAEMARFAALLQQKRDALGAPPVGAPHAPIGLGGAQLPAPRSPADSSVGDQVQRHAEYDALRAEARRRFPILVAFDEDPGALAQVATGRTPEAAAYLGQTIREKLDAIQAVLRALDAGELSAWLLPQIVDGTQRELGILPKSMRAAVVAETMHDKADAKALPQAILGAVTFALGLIAAIPTGGASVALAAVTTAAGAAGAGLTLYNAALRLQSYVLESAERNTHFDRAMAISQEDPSLFWLAVDLAGAFASIAVAVNAFRQLRAVLAAPKFGPKDLEELARVARRVLPEEHAERLIARASGMVKSGLRVTTTIRLSGAALSEAERAQIGLALARYSEEAYTAAFLELSAAGRVRPLTREALIEVYGEAAGPHLQKYFGTKGVTFGGFYENKAYPLAKSDVIRIHKGIVFIHGDASLGGVAGKVVHELTHHFQDMYWESAWNLVTFNKELMAFSAQQALLRRVAADAGVHAVPAESRWMLEATEQQLCERIKTNYGLGPEVEAYGHLVAGQGGLDRILRELIETKMRAIDRQEQLLAALKAKAHP